jgi:hypothetical protein
MLRGCGERTVKTEFPDCPCCGSADVSNALPALLRAPMFRCKKCDCTWDQSKRSPADKQETLPSNIVTMDHKEALAKLNIVIPDGYFVTCGKGHGDVRGALVPAGGIAGSVADDDFQRAKAILEGMSASRNLSHDEVVSIRIMVEAARPPNSPAGGEGAEMVWPDYRTFQARVQPWMMECFSMEICRNTIERNHRFLEESLELVQALGCTASEAHQLVDYTFGRPVGEAAQEAGGVMVTLAALCIAADMDMHECGEVELRRIWGMIDVIRAKQAAKPPHSPLPEAPSASPLDEARERERFEACPVATGDDAKGGWKIAFSFLKKVQNGCEHEDLVQLEEIEDVLLSAARARLSSGDG